MRDLTRVPLHRIDPDVRGELERAKIILIRHDYRVDGEVPTHFSGELRRGDAWAFVFDRMSTFWRATGLINWDMLRQLPHLRGVELGPQYEPDRRIELQAITFFIQTEPGLRHFVEDLRGFRLVNAWGSDDPLPETKSEGGS